MVNFMDSKIGELVDALHTKAMWDDSILFFSADKCVRTLPQPVLPLCSACALLVTSASGPVRCTAAGPCCRACALPVFCSADTATPPLTAVAALSTETGVRAPTTTHVRTTHSYAFSTCLLSVSLTRICLIIAVKGGKATNWWV